MKRLLLGATLFAALGVIVLSLTSSGTRAQQLTLEDLAYGAVDVDGDGRYTRGDDYVVEQLLIRAPHHLTEALKTARIHPDGGIDLSPYLLSITAEKIEAERARQ